MRMVEYLCRYGEDIIDAAGIAVLKYPGLWITDMWELKKIRPWLINNYPDK